MSINKKQVHVYEHCKVYEILSADTIQLSIDFGFNTWGHWKCYLFGIAAPDKSTEAGQMVTEIVRFMLSAGPITKVQSIAWDDYSPGFSGRIHLGQMCLNDRLCQLGLARPDLGGTRIWSEQDFADIVQNAKAYNQEYRIPQPQTHAFTKWLPQPRRTVYED